MWILNLLNFCYKFIKSNRQRINIMLIYKTYAGVLELVDEADSKSVVSDGVWVRVPPPAPKLSPVTLISLKLL
mgnify:CR=1 FL=1